MVIKRGLRRTWWSKNWDFMEIYILRVSRMLPSTGTTRVARWCLDARHSIEQAKIMIAAAKFTLRSSNVATCVPGRSPMYTWFAHCNYNVFGEFPSHVWLSEGSCEGCQIFAWNMTKTSAWLHGCTKQRLWSRSSRLLVLLFCGASLFC